MKVKNWIEASIKIPSFLGKGGFPISLLLLLLVDGGHHRTETS